MSSSPYPILETLMKRGFLIELSMGNDGSIYTTASDGWHDFYEASGKTISESIINLSHKIPDEEKKTAAFHPTWLKCQRNLERR